MSEIQIFVGTSGWYYSWNPELSFEWYAKNSGLNAIELNSSFYRFPFPNQVKSWALKTQEINPELRWSVKVNRFITHVFKFSEKALSTWKKFETLFEPLNESIDFYLFQLPPNLRPSYASKLEKFIRKTNLKERFALEVRNLEWFSGKWIKWAKDLEITWVSIDAPDYTNFPREIYCTSGMVYERMHGRSEWYSHDYTRKELTEVARRIVRTKPKKAFILFNNNHAMLTNGRLIRNILKELTAKNDA